MHRRVVQPSFYAVCACEEVRRVSGRASASPFCSVRIQYSGPPGSLQALVSSVESRGNLVVDSHVQNEGNGWAGSGGHPWHLDGDTESILFLTNESDKPARIGFKVSANSVTYYLTSLRLNPHETRALDLRDAQQPDLNKNTIPGGAADGSVIWGGWRIRHDGFCRDVCDPKRMYCSDV